jgi:hypothetical protein
MKEFLDDNAKVLLRVFDVVSCRMIVATVGGQVANVAELWQRPL